MKKAIVSLSFDDGRKDNYKIFQDILQKYELSATINIATGYIEGKVNAALQPAMSIEQIIELSTNELFEIACHGDLHSNDLEDIVSGREKLLDWLNLPKDYQIGFASPGSEMNLEYINENESFFRQRGFEYVRTGPRIESKKYLRKILRRLARIVKFKFLFRFVYSETIQLTKRGVVLFSVPILKETTVDQIIELIKYTCKKRGLCVLMFHSIQPKGTKFYSDNWTYDFKKFEQLCRKIAELRDEEKIEVKTTSQAYKSLQ